MFFVAFAKYFEIWGQKGYFSGVIHSGRDTAVKLKFEIIPTFLRFFPLIEGFLKLLFLFLLGKTY